MLLCVNILNVIFYFHNPLAEQDAELAVSPPLSCHEEMLGSLPLTIPLLKTEMNSTSLLCLLTSVTHQAQLTHKAQLQKFPSLISCSCCRIMTWLAGAGLAA